MSEEIWKTIINITALLKYMLEDKYSEVTNLISKKDTFTSHYNSFCCNNYTTSRVNHTNLKQFSGAE